MHKYTYVGTRQGTVSIRTSLRSHLSVYFPLRIASLLSLSTLVCFNAISTIRVIYWLGRRFRDFFHKVENANGLS